MSIDQLEQRLTAVEQAVAALQQQLASPPAVKPGLQGLIGSMAGFPEFDQVMEHVRRRREAELAEFDDEPPTP